MSVKNIQVNERVDSNVAICIKSPVACIYKWTVSSRPVRFWSAKGTSFLIVSPNSIKFLKYDTAYIKSIDWALNL